jgi:glutamine synthetase
MNISTAITVINTIVADSIDTLVAKIKKQAKKDDLTIAVLNVLSQTIAECEPILFEGNNYGEEWLAEAKKRGLVNESSPPKALKALISSSNSKLFEKHGVFTKDELEARYNAWLDIYNKILHIEGRTLVEIVNTQILPPAYDFQIEVGNSLDVLKELADDETIPIPIHAVDDRKEMFTKLTNDIYYIRKNTRELAEKLAFAEKLDTKEMAAYMSNQIKPLLEHVRRHVDDLESIMPDDQWLLPKYREMLFVD